MTEQSARQAAIATFAIFAINGLVFASWAARIPAVARILDLSDGAMGILLLTMAAGSVLALPLAGSVAARIGTASTVRLGGFTVVAGGLVISLALSLPSLPLTAVGLICFGIGIGLWDVAQNLEGAEVERHLGRTIMPKFHAGFSGGALVGALAGAGLSAAGISMSLHLLVIVLLVAVAMVFVPRLFLPEIHGTGVATVPAEDVALAAAPTATASTETVSTASASTATASTGSTGLPRSPWRESRTLLVGLVVMGAALTEGAANDWIAKATVDGLGTSESGGAFMFAAFVASMTLFRYFGAGVIDRFGRVPVLYASLGASLVGLVVFVMAPTVLLAGVAAVLWGAGAAMGFPIGMSAAADDPARAAVRVSVVSTIGYVAFLAGPPLLGFLGDHVTIRRALLAVGVVVLASLFTVSAAKPLPTADGAATQH